MRWLLLLPLLLTTLSCKPPPPPPGDGSAAVRAGAVALAQQLSRGNVPAAQYYSVRGEAEEAVLLALIEYCSTGDRLMGSAAARFGGKALALPVPGAGMVERFQRGRAQATADGDVGTLTDTDGTTWPLCKTDEGWKVDLRRMNREGSMTARVAGYEAAAAANRWLVAELESGRLATLADLDAALTRSAATLPKR